MSWGHVAAHIAAEAPELSAALAELPPDTSVEGLVLAGRAGEAAMRGNGALSSNGSSMRSLYASLNDAHIDALVSALQIQGIVPALRHLECRNQAGVGDGCAESLGRFLMDSECVLETLDLTGCEFSGAGCTVLCGALERNGSLRALKLAWNQLERKGGLAIADMLRYNDRLEELDLCNTGMDTCAVVQLLAVLRDHRGLVTVDLQKALLFSREEDTTVHAAAMVQSNRVLQSLNLANCLVGDGGAEALAKALTANTTLRHLGLKNNQIGPAGGVALAELLQSSSAGGGTCSLWSLDLGANRVGDDGAAALGEALAANTNLRALDLSANRIADRGLTAIAKGMSINSSLRGLRLWGNDFPPASSAASSSSGGGGGDDNATGLLYKLLVGRWSHLEVVTDLEPYEVDGAVKLAFSAPPPASA